jgi:LuxR family maltose regulon positive regulatory protein
MSISVFLVDDHAMFRKGLHLLIAEEPDMSVVGEAGDGRAAIEKVRELSPDVVVMDITMPNLNGIDATRQILSDSPHSKVVALSIHAGKRFVKDMLAAGATGYIVKDSIPEELITCIRKVMHNEVYLSSEITGVVVSGFLGDQMDEPSSETPDEGAPLHSNSTLFTKIHRPLVDKNHIHRSTLIDRLDQSIRRPVTLVSAPAGYGKTVLVSRWLEANSIPSAWVSLDKNDNDAHLFLSYFLSAVRSLFPDACPQTLATATVAPLPSPPALARNLINELDRIEQPFILVLDDFHLIKNQFVLDLLTQLLQHPPHIMNLVLIGRRDPPLPITKLRSQGLLTEIRTQGLRFSRGETKTFLEQLMGTQIDPSTVAALHKKTEGWVTGLRLAFLSMRHRGNIDPKLLGAQVNAQYVMEYLFVEVFSSQPSEIRSYLLGTAILDRFCGPLCEAVRAPGTDASTCEHSGWDFIAWLKEENLFVIPLDTENRWFRYHHLFQRLLVNQLKRHCSTEEINLLHSRASGWFAEEGLIEEALEHALAAGDITGAIQLVARHGHQLMDDHQWPRLARWLDMLPRDSVEENPEMLLFRLWLNHMRTAGFDASALAAQLDKIENLISTSSANGSITVEQVRSHCHALRSFQYFMGADGKGALKHARLACENIPIRHKRAWLRAQIFQAASFQMIGELETGLSIFYEEVEKNPNLSNSDKAMYLANLCFMYWIDADLITMLQTTEKTLKIAMNHRVQEAIAFSLYFSGIASYHQNNLQSADEKLARVVKEFHMYMQLVHTHGSFCLSLIYQAQGQADRASERNSKMMEYAIDTGNQKMLQTTRAFEAELALRQGHLAEASTWANRFRPTPLVPPFGFYMPQLTLVKILLAQDTTDSRHQAAELLNQLHEFLVSIHNIVFQIDVLALKALLLDTQKEESAALKALTESLKLAEPGGFIRPFVDVGLPMADLLKKLVRQNIAVGYIGRILAAFRAEEQTVISDQTDQPATNQPLSTTQPLLEPLTNRELEILNLLAHRLSNKEIAVKLFISPTTVKKHLNNIYGKLTASNRQQAVAKARQLNIV